MKRNRYFSVYRHGILLPDDSIIYRQFIVIKNQYGDITQFTNLHKYIHSKRKNAAKSITDDGNKRFIYIANMLNYIFVDNRQKYNFECIADITFDAVQDFFNYYSVPDDQQKLRSRITLDKCLEAVTDFLLSLVKDRLSGCRLKLEDIVEERYYLTRHGRRMPYYISNFNIHYTNKDNRILRDMPNSVFNFILGYCASYHINILMAITLSAFAGLRPSEACNVRQEISPLGRGIKITRQGNLIIDIEIDITREMPLRSDFRPVGKIKKERKAKVFQKFFNAFMQCYKLYCEDYLSKVKFEDAYCPLNVNTRGRAMTYQSYYTAFRKMIEELVPIMLKQNNVELQEYGQLLLEHNISPHIFRHWFSVRLALYGVEPAQLQTYRGDKSIESSLLYLSNKSELSKKYKSVNDIFLNSMMDFVTENTLQKGDGNDRN